MKTFTFAKLARAVLIAAAVAGGALFVPGCFVDWDNDSSPCTCDANTGGGNNTGGEHVHAWGGWVVTTAATCDVAGVEMRTCTKDANHKETREIARLTGEACQSGGGGAFKTVTIGGQTWMAENLNVVTEGSWCYGEGGQEVVGVDADDNPIFRTLSSSEIQDNCNKYGRLYTWAAAKSACPRGWKLPTIEDWEILVMEIGVRKEDEYGDVWYEDWQDKLKAKSGWDGPCHVDGCRSINGTDDYGFSALPGSLRFPDVVENPFGAVVYFRWGSTVHWWTASEGRDYYNEPEYEAVVMRFDYQGSPGYDKRFAFPVRCIAD